MAIAINLARSPLAIYDSPPFPVPLCALMVSRSQLLLLLLVGSLAAAAAGCNYYHPRIRNPGTVEQQRLRATIHDPYPDPDLGPSDGGSGRPRDYQRPLPEPVRNRIYWDSTIWRR